MMNVALITTHTWVGISTSVINSALVLANNGYHVDLFIASSQKFAIPKFENLPISVIVDSTKLLNKFLLRDAVFALKGLLSRKRYKFIIGFDPEGLIRAGLFSFLSGTPLIYHSLEILTLDEHATFKQRVVKKLERWFSKQAKLTLVQDAYRADILALDNRVATAKFEIAYNSPIGEPLPFKDNYLRQKLMIPKDRIVVLAVGTLSKETSIDQIIAAVNNWPEKFILVLHGWIPDKDFDERIRAEVKKYPQKIFLSTDLLDKDQKYKIFQSADIGLVFFEPLNMNLKYGAGSAGKLFDFMRVGVPVVGNDIPGMRSLIENNGCGIVVKNASNLGIALPKIIEKYEIFWNGALAAYENYRFENCYEKVLDRIKGVLNESKW